MLSERGGVSVIRCARRRSARVVHRLFQQNVGELTGERNPRHVFSWVAHGCFHFGAIVADGDARRQADLVNRPFCDPRKTNL